MKIGGYKMNRKKFLQKLKQALNGQISSQEIQEHVEYYETYILEQMQKGLEEHEIIKQLGDPRLIAKTIIETSGKRESTYSNETFADKKMREEKKKYQKGFHIDYTSDGGIDIRIGRFKVNSWYGGVIIITLFLILIGLVGSIFMALIPIIVPVALVLLLVKLSKESK